MGHKHQTLLNDYYTWKYHSMKISSNQMLQLLHRQCSAKWSFNFIKLRMCFLIYAYSLLTFRSFSKFSVSGCNNLAAASAAGADMREADTRWEDGTWNAKYEIMLCLYCNSDYNGSYTFFDFMIYCLTYRTPNVMYTARVAPPMVARPLAMREFISDLVSVGTMDLTIRTVSL